jgi:hypothetical protein
MLAFAARAQDADSEADAVPKTNATVPKARAPLVINDDTIGELRMRQVGSIILPQGTPPFPAVVVLHGCNGVSQNTRAWARRLASWGYAALIIDSFTSRGLEQVCDGSRALPGPVRAKDAFVAAAYLRSRPDIDGSRIGALGYSHGGWTALIASMKNASSRKAGRHSGRLLRFIRSVRRKLRRRSLLTSRFSSAMPTIGRRPRTVEPLWKSTARRRRTGRLWLFIPAHGILSVQTGRIGYILVTSWCTIRRRRPTLSNALENFSTNTYAAKR